ncbi:MAG: sulfite exporter TauE/SafE family protein [Spirochaetia bacterium]|nr:sulfite exporter TauE/SafE family protein [Spirochaetia bacterium]
MRFSGRSGKSAPVPDITTSYSLFFFLFGSVVLFAFATQAITGFGGTVIAVTLGAHMFSLDSIIPVMVALNVPLCIYFIWIGRAQVDWRLVFRGILLWMTPGILVGALVMRYLPSQGARPLFGAIILLFAVRELWRLYSGAVSAPGMPAWLFHAVVFTSGITHGMYASGGPLLVYAASRSNLTKGAFRSTLMMVWLVTNGILIGMFAYQGRWTENTGWTSLALFPVVPLGIVIGEWLHHRISIRGFWILVQSVLLIAGAAFFVH